MRKILAVSLVLGVASAGAFADDAFSTNLGPNNAHYSGVFTGMDDGVIVWDNGPANGVNGVQPTAGWDPSGIMDDFILPDVNGTVFSGVRVEMIDGTTPIGSPSIINSARVQIFELGGGGLGGLTHGTDVPVFDRTYTLGDGSLSQTLPGIIMFNRDLIYMDMQGPEFDLGPGTFAMFVSYPGFGQVPAINSFIAYSDGGGHSTEDAHVFGPGVNSPFTNPSDVAFNLTIPEPASLALLGLGSLVMLRRRR